MDRLTDQVMRAQRPLTYSIPSTAPAWGLPEMLATLRCLVSGQIIEGNDRTTLASRLGQSLNVPYVLPVNRGRCAIELALRSLEVTDDDEVILPSFVCKRVLHAVERTGARPVPADLGEGFHVDVPEIRSKLTSRTRAVVVAHMFGEMASIGAIERELEGSGVALIDDAAQAFGARSGGRCASTFGTCGAISTGIGKPLEGTAGGAFVTRSRDLFERARELVSAREDPVIVLRRSLAGWVWHRLRRFTSPFKERSDRLFSQNATSRVEPRIMSNLDAAIAIRQLEAFQSQTEKRRRRAREVAEAIGSNDRVRAYRIHSSSLALALPVFVSSASTAAENLIAELWDLGIEARRGYTPLHRDLGLAAEDFPRTEALWRQLVVVPLTRPLNRRQRQGLRRLRSARSPSRTSEQ